MGVVTNALVCFACLDTKLKFGLLYNACRAVWTRLWMRIFLYFLTGKKKESKKVEIRDPENFYGTGTCQCKNVAVHVSNGEGLPYTTTILHGQAQHVDHTIKQPLSHLLITLHPL